MKRTKIWVVSHGEVVLSPEPRVDEAVFYAASSLAGARRLIRKTRIEPGTWWRIQPCVYDSLDRAPGPDLLFSSTGTKLRRIPFKAGQRAAMARLKAQIESLPQLIVGARRRGESARIVRILERTLTGLRRLKLEVARLRL